MGRVEKKIKIEKIAKENNMIMQYIDIAGQRPLLNKSLY